MRTILIALMFVLAWGQTASAHKPKYKVKFTNGARLKISPVPLPGRVELKLSAPIPGGSLVLEDVRLNAVPLADVVFDLDGSTSRDYEWFLPFETFDQDKLEIGNVILRDATRATVGERGGIAAGAGPTFLSVPLVYVVDSKSHVGYTRGGDSFVYPNGKWSIGFDALRVRPGNAKLNNAGNRAEIEYSIDGGPWRTEELWFNVQSGKSQPHGRPRTYLTAMQPNAVVRVRRITVYDPSGVAFATPGVRMGRQGHYADTVDDE